MLESVFGPFLFDTSAESWLERSTDAAVRRWHADYLRLHTMRVSAITVTERIRGYAMLLERAAPRERAGISFIRDAYLSARRQVVPVGREVAFVAGELAAMLPQPPTAPKRAHRAAETRQERLVRWRYDILIAATSLAAGLTLVHFNPQDFETIRMAIETSPERLPGVGPLNLVNVIRLAVKYP